ncbi:MAG: BPSL0067 family protein [Betaproteobacteria bacterium]|nr:BPSL0067 family protein [Betaproteobacteria bacterium]
MQGPFVCFNAMELQWQKVRIHEDDDTRVTWRINATTTKTECPDGHHVALIKAEIPALKNIPTSLWKKGQNVMEAIRREEKIQPGTAIAIFNEDGTFDTSHLGQAALFLEATKNGFAMLCQEHGAGRDLLLKRIQPHETEEKLRMNASRYFVIML